LKTWRLATLTVATVALLGGVSVTLMVESAATANL